MLAGAAVGFLWWNWSPAKVFFGDVGSVPLGFLLGWLLLTLAGHGYWAAAIILPLYYLVDATLTLLERLARGEKIWEAHRSHYYQQAVQKGLSHAHVSRLILTGNVVLIGLCHNIYPRACYRIDWCGSGGICDVVIFSKTSLVGNGKYHEHSLLLRKLPAGNQRQQRPESMKGLFIGPDGDIMSPSSPAHQTSPMVSFSTDIQIPGTRLKS